MMRNSMVLLSLDGEGNCETGWDAVAAIVKPKLSGYDHGRTFADIDTADRVNALPREAATRGRHATMVLGGRNLGSGRPEQSGAAAPYGTTNEAAAARVRSAIREEKHYGRGLCLLDPNSTRPRIDRDRAQAREGAQAT